MAKRTKRVCRISAEQAAKEALDQVRLIMETSDDDELTTFSEFAEVFGAALEGWEMRIEELEDTDLEDE